MEQVTEFAPDDFVAVTPAALGGAFEDDEIWHRAFEAKTHFHGAKACLEGCEDVWWRRAGVVHVGV